jgi:hypothetical protein
MEMNEQQLTALVVNTVREAIAAKNAEDDFEALKAKTANLEKELADMKGEGKAKNESEAYEGKETNEEEEKEEKEGNPVENAKPSQALIAAFATALNIDFGAKTPSFATLAKLSGITETDPFARITAVNAKFSELAKKSVSVTNTDNVEVF